MRGHAPRSKTRINLDSNEGNNDGKYDDDNSGSDNEDCGGGNNDDDDNDDEDDGINNFLFIGKNATNSGLPLSPFIGETKFVHCT